MRQMRKIGYFAVAEFINYMILMLTFRKNGIKQNGDGPNDGNEPNDGDKPNNGDEPNDDDKPNNGNEPLWHTFFRCTNTLSAWKVLLL